MVRIIFDQRKEVRHVAALETQRDRLVDIRRIGEIREQIRLDVMMKPVGDGQIDVVVLAKEIGDVGIVGVVARHAAFDELLVGLHIFFDLLEQRSREANAASVRGKPELHRTSLLRLFHARLAYVQCLGFGRECLQVVDEERHVDVLIVVEPAQPSISRLGEEVDGEFGRAIATEVADCMGLLTIAVIDVVMVFFGHEPMEQGAVAVGRHVRRVWREVKPCLEDDGHSRSLRVFRRAHDEENVIGG